MILGTGQLANSLKNTSKTVGKLSSTKQMTITGKWHGCHFKKLFSQVRQIIFLFFYSTEHRNGGVLKSYQKICLLSWFSMENIVCLRVATTALKQVFTYNYLPHLLLWKNINYYTLHSSFYHCFTIATHYLQEIKSS